MVRHKRRFRTKFESVSASCRISFDLLPIRRRSRRTSGASQNSHILTTHCRRSLRSACLCTCRVSAMCATALRDTLDFSSGLAGRRAIRTSHPSPSTMSCGCCVIHSRSGEKIDALIGVCANGEAPLTELPEADSAMETAVIACASHVILQTSRAPAAADALKTGPGRDGMAALDGLFSLHSNRPLLDQSPHGAAVRGRSHPTDEGA